MALHPLLKLPLIQLLFSVSGLGLALASYRGIAGFNRAVGAFVGLFCLYAGVLQQWYVWPAYLALPIIGAAGLAACGGFWSDFRRAGRLGRFGRREAAVIVLISIASSIALALWVRYAQPDLTPYRQRLLPDWPLTALILGGLLFSILNAVMEEYVWRGLLLQWLDATMSPGAAIATQALSFGLFHYFGFPSGSSGVFLSTAYGGLLGVFAFATGGIGAAILAHIAADMVIFSIIMIGA